jgi:hypothetical protein
MLRVLPGLTRANAVIALRWLLMHYTVPPKAECDEAWESFPELPGEHLRFHQTARGCAEIVTEDRQVLATAEVRNFPGDTPRRVTIGHVTYGVRRQPFTLRVTDPDDLTILSFTGGKNFNREAMAVAEMPDGQLLLFPVRGTWISNAVMTAKDEAGSPVFRLRDVRNAWSGQQRKKVALFAMLDVLRRLVGRGDPPVVEIVVEPGRQITPEMLLVIATGYNNLYTFFDRPQP